MVLTWDINERGERVASMSLEDLAELGVAVCGSCTNFNLSQHKLMPIPGTGRVLFSWLTLKQKQCDKQHHPSKANGKGDAKLFDYTESQISSHPGADSHGTNPDHLTGQPKSSALKLDVLEFSEITKSKKKVFLAI